MLSGPGLCRIPSKNNLCGAYQRGSQYQGRLSKPPIGMAVKSKNIFQDHSLMGNPSSGSFCHQAQQTGQRLSFPKSSRQTLGSGRTISDFEMGLGLRLSSPGSYSQRYKKDQRGQSNSYTYRSILATESTVLLSEDYVSNRPLGSPGNPGSSQPRPGPSSRCPQPLSDSLALERIILKPKGLSDAVICTLQYSRKPVTTKIYFRIWKKF
ncbi:uncharacterized protein LOC130284934 isoform X3 [Hyla sarda]|uniref:uncharacterized protein LOC130284934 isoform X3 n=1 Tax=Hyla sarda TaxID=327740 RepID=UPI0024C2931B|nr:uncharacterized protein LOC130284934 isoform X3 [Hyla sarda]